MVEEAEQGIFILWKSCTDHEDDRGAGKLQSADRGAVQAQLARKGLECLWRDEQGRKLEAEPLDLPASLQKCAKV